MANFQEFKNSRIANREKNISFIAYVMIFKNQEFKNSGSQEFKNSRFHSLDQTGSPPGGGGFATVCF